MPSSFTSAQSFRITFSLWSQKDNPSWSSGARNRRIADIEALSISLTLKALTTNCDLVLCKKGWLARPNVVMRKLIKLGWFLSLPLFVCFIVRISQHNYVFHVWLLFITVHILSQWQWKCEVVGLVTFSSRWQRLFFQMVSIKIAFKKLIFFSMNL